MILRIISIENILFNGSVDMVTLPGICGSFTVLNDHAPLMTVLTEGSILYTDKGRKENVQIKGGMVEVRSNRITVTID